MAKGLNARPHAALDPTAPNARAGGRRRARGRVTSLGLVILALVSPRAALSLPSSEDAAPLRRHLSPAEVQERIAGMEQLQAELQEFSRTFSHVRGDVPTEGSAVEMGSEYLGEGEMVRQRDSNPDASTAGVNSTAEEEFPSEDAGIFQEDAGTGRGYLRGGSSQGSSDAWDAFEASTVSADEPSLDMEGEVVLGEEYMGESYLNRNKGEHPGVPGEGDYSGSSTEENVLMGELEDFPTDDDVTVEEAGVTGGRAREGESGFSGTQQWASTLQHFLRRARSGASEIDSGAGWRRRFSSPLLSFLQEKASDFVRCTTDLGGGGISAGEGESGSESGSGSGSGFGEDAFSPYDLPVEPLRSEDRSAAVVHYHPGASAAMHKKIGMNVRALWNWVVRKRHEK